LRRPAGERFLSAQTQTNRLRRPAGDALIIKWLSPLNHSLVLAA
jgi:hypothetical protein